MGFNTEKNKLFKIWNSSILNEFEINNISSNNKIILNKIKRLNDANAVYNNIIELSSDWVIPNTITLKNTPDYILDMFTEYSITFNGINKKMIPYINSKVSYRVGSDGASAPVPIDTNDPTQPFDEGLSQFLINSFTQILQSNSNQTKNIIYKTSVYLRKGNGDGVPSDLQFKFYINLINPNYYQST